jgi:hypothetical protein
MMIQNPCPTRTGLTELRQLARTILGGNGAKECFNKPKNSWQRRSRLDSDGVRCLDRVARINIHADAAQAV